MLPRFTPELCAGLRTAFLRTGYHVDGVPELLGGAAHAALGRDEPVPARIAAASGGPLGALVRLFLLGDTVAESEVTEALAPVTVSEAITGGLLRRSVDGAGLIAALDVRPHGDDGGSWWVVSDLEPGRLTGQHQAPEADHVLGVGHASLSLAAATVRKPAGRLLDLGTGCGVQALHAAGHAEHLVATDVNPRALALAAGTFGLSGLDVELRGGSWLEPVAGERFDQIITNPPFVAGPARVRHTYRDSGLAGDAVAARLVETLPEHLAEGGIAQLLACWLHVRGEDWPERVTSWLPVTIGVDAWFVQREITDPAHYVGTWLRDSGIDPASPVGQREAGEWLDWFAGNDVEAVGFGFILLRRTDAEPTVLCEDLREGLIDPLGVESAAWLDRVDWLRAHHTDEALLAARLSVAPSVVLEQISTPSVDGWFPAASTVRRVDGPGWRHDVDEPAAALLAGCQGALPLGELFELLAFAHDRPTGELVAAALPGVREFIRHGLLVPSEWSG